MEGQACADLGARTPIGSSGSFPCNTFLFWQSGQDVLHCQVDGSKEMLLVDPKEYPEIESLLELDMAPKGRASLLNR